MLALFLATFHHLQVTRKSFLVRGENVIGSK